MTVCPRCGGEMAAPPYRCGACGFTTPVAAGVPCFAPDDAAASGDYDPAFFARLAALEDGHFWFESRNRLILHAMARFLPERGRFLEIGCGSGFVLRGVRRRFPAWELMGSEVHVQGIEVAAGRLPDAQLVQLDARRLPFVAHFDAVGAFDVLEHIEEDELVLAQIRRALLPGGRLFLTVPQHPSLWSGIDELAMHKRRYTRRELTQKVRAAGFAVEMVTSFVSLLLPAMWLARRLRRRAQTIDPMAEFRISRAANRLLGWLLGLEVFLTTRLGVRWPAGGSLLLVARAPDQRPA